MHENCTIYNVVDFVSKKWSLLIILEIYKGRVKRKRYSEIKKSLPGITPKILSTRLKELVERGIIVKKVIADSFPIRTEYALTPSGRDFVKIIKDIKSWGLRWDLRKKVCENQNCKDCEL